MEGIQRWIDRLRETGPDDLQPYLRRIVSPGLKGLQVTECLLGSQPVGPVSPTINGSAPGWISELRFIDGPGQAESLPRSQALSADLGVLLTLALERRVEVLNEASINVPQINTRIYMPVGHVVDKEALGPLPDDVCQRVEEFLSLVDGLERRDAHVIGSAARSYHAALSIFEAKLSGAYALLVAGIETLSREYGNPPTNWTDWEHHESWDSLFETVQLTDDQRGAVRSKLMENRQIRLRATFREYGSTRLAPEFWDKTLVDWTYGINANENRWHEAVAGRTYQVREVLMEDRTELSQALAKSYDLRSGVVHAGDEVPFVEQLVFGDSPVAPNRPIPFFLLRQILRALIEQELRERTSPRELPDIQML